MKITLPGYWKRLEELQRKTLRPMKGKGKSVFELGARFEKEVSAKQMTINSFSGGYLYLSNFCENVPVLLDGLHFRNSEAAYQAGKAAALSVRKLFVDLTPDEAKKLGKAIDIRKDWMDIRADHMRRVIHAKFTQNPLPAEALIATGTAELEEGNHWHDNFFH